MGKSFEVSYSPSSWNAPTGGVASSWTTPYGGLNTLAPENLIGPQFTPAMDNMILRNGELTSRPAFIRYLPSPDGVNPILGLGSFLDPTLVWHTFAFTIGGLYQLVANSDAVVAAGGNPWVLIPGAFPLTCPPFHMTWAVFQGILYFSGSFHTQAWDGLAAAVIPDVAFPGVVSPPVTLERWGGNFIGELDSHIILAYTHETDGAGSQTEHPQRVRWSNNGFNPTNALGVFGGNLGTAGATFDPTVNVNAGFVDFLDVPDAISGLLFIGRMGYVFRNNGITEMSPTGKGVAPFDFNHLWASEHGIGNVFVGTVAQYGNVGMFISEENVYKISPQSLAAVGGGARDLIMSDLAKAASIPKVFITPAFVSGYIYLTYHLLIPLANGTTRIYVFSFDDNNWMSWTVSSVVLGQPGICWVSNTINIPPEFVIIPGGRI